MNKIIKTRVGDEIHYYVNGVESYGVVAKMSNSFVTIFKEDGLFYEVPLTDTFFVKDILINKTWNNMSMEERADELVKIKAYSPRFLSKSWEQLPPELREVMKSPMDKKGIPVPKKPTSTGASNTNAAGYGAGIADIKYIKVPENIATPEFEERARTSVGARIPQKKLENDFSFNKRADREVYRDDKGYFELVPSSNIKAKKYQSGKYGAGGGKKDTISKLNKALTLLIKYGKIMKSPMDKQGIPEPKKPTSTGASNTDTAGYGAGKYNRKYIKVPEDIATPEFKERARTSVGARLRGKKLENDFSFNDPPDQLVYHDGDELGYYKIVPESDIKAKKIRSGRHGVGGGRKDKRIRSGRHGVGGGRKGKGKEKQPDPKSKLKELMTTVAKARAAAKSDQEQGLYGTAGSSSNVGISTDTKIDADKEYEGESHEDKKEEFKYEDEKPKVDQDKNKAVPLSQLNTWGIRYMTKEEREKFNSGQ